MANESRGTILKFITGNIVPVAVVLAVFLLFVPIPKFIIDLSMILNLTLAIVILLVVVRTPRPSDFQTFPRVILFQTLFSLGINISSTRLILTGRMQGGALLNQSDMVKAFARIVAGNNLVVGFVIFIILIVVQVLVVTKGAGRVSEVAARFSLDSMNQKLFDIDNRLNSGAIDEAQAEILKEAVRRDIDFYSNMDGSSKFVSGNVKAGIFITVINLLGGFIVGMVMNRMGAVEAINTYSTLTIGDGLTSQLPSLIISFATGLLVTGTKSDESLDQQLKVEFTGDGHIYEIVGGVLIVAGLALRGGTQLLLLPVGALAIFIGYTMTRDKQKKEIAQQQEKAQKASAKSSSINDSERIVMLDPLSLELGYALIPLVDQEKGAELLERISRIRVEARHDIGLDIPKIHIQDNMTLEPNDYSFKIAGIEAGHSAVRVGYVMCLDTGTVTDPIDGEKTKDPAFGMDAIWLPEDRRSEAEGAGYVIVDPPTIISTHITEIIKNHAAELLDRQAVSVILDTVKQKNPVLVSEVLDTAKISYGTIEKVLQNLLEERVSIRNYVRILETMANYAAVTHHNVWELTQKVRDALGLQICMQYADDNKKIHVMRLSQELSELIAEHAYNPEDGSKPYVALDPVDRRRWVQAVSTSLAKVSQLGYQPVIITVSSVRQLVRSSLEREMPGVAVISDTEMYAAGSSISPEIIDEIADVENE
ncbi:flagellar biosynthesis protein FlhA [Treponema bryantii]|uniref:Flagellar biosynthesis protein FlhA n=1 Tax=Treponema bryantii TaxID=163 RepID=A0A1I3IUP5_9SPIR|nr:flagellar biosynthesis protein FlhA [Treponema bryantii]SFI51662.1 flagellar biosynthesis protein FlhA [Treponema bryantii]